jgi:small subunit ribosomal protein S20
MAPFSLRGPEIGPPEGSMANSKQAEKRVRQAALRRERNRDAKGQMRGAIKRVRKAMEEGDLEQVRALLPLAVSRIDKTAKKGVIHRNTASRYKSALEKKVRALETSSS